MNSAASARPPAAPAALRLRGPAARLPTLVLSIFLRTVSPPHSSLYSSLNCLRMLHHLQVLQVGEARSPHICKQWVRQQPAAKWCEFQRQSPKPKIKALFCNTTPSSHWQASSQNQPAPSIRRCAPLMSTNNASISREVMLEEGQMKVKAQKAHSAIIVKEQIPK